MENKFDAIIVTTASDYRRVRANYRRIIDLMPADKIIFIGNEEVGELVKGEEWSDRAGFMNENDILPFDRVHAVMKEILKRDDIPRGVTGWYYQQFLKMKYADYSRNPYYMVWDGDTVPTKHFEMFDDSRNHPYFDMKYEYHEEYFITIEKLFPGMKKALKKSFISEHMIFSVEIMQEMIKTIEESDYLTGNSFYEKILKAVRPEEIVSNSFSEFETYGTYVAFKHPSIYKLKDWHSIRYGSIYFIPEELTEEDYAWISKDFDAVSFEKNMEYNPDIAALFINPTYRQKLSARQIIEAIQDSSSEGMREEWEDDKTKSTTVSDSEEIIEPDKSIGDEYLLFNYLGDNLLRTNVNQAYLCYQNAEFLCPDGNLKAVLRDKKNRLLSSGDVTVEKTSIVIVSYNATYLMQQCLYSIRKYCARDAYEVVIVDNASTDGVTEWLKKQTDITLLLSDENMGFPKGCNVGIEYSDKNADILLLNNDTRMTHNALFWLRMGLYEDDYVGATGSVSNYCGIDQLEDITFDLPGDYVEYGSKINVLMKMPYEEKNRLCGFSMLMRRKVFDEIGHLEEALSPGYFEDDDISFEIHIRGYRLLVCHNSYIYHAGSQSFTKRNDLKEIAERNHRFMINKWGYDCITYSTVTKEEYAALDIIDYTKNGQFRILEIGAGSGNMISRIKYLYPLATVYGVEENEMAVRHGVEMIPLLCLDWKNKELPFVDQYFDYIIVNDRENKNYSQQYINEKLQKYIKTDGKIVVVKLV